MKNETFTLENEKMIENTFTLELVAYSECCGEYCNEDAQLCPRCGEHCEVVTEEIPVATR